MNAPRAHSSKLGAHSFLFAIALVLPSCQGLTLKEYPGPQPPPDRLPPLVALRGSVRIRAVDPATGAQAFEVPTWHDDFGPGPMRWSPDGSKLAYVLESQSAHGALGSLWLFDRVSRRSWELIPADVNFSDTSLTWASNTELVCERLVDGNFQSHVVDIERGRARLLTRGASAQQPDACSRQREVAYVTRGAIHVVALRGSARRLTAGPQHARPRWSRDGTWIAYVEKARDENRLWVIDPDGAHAIQVHAAAALTSASWSPDGRQLAFRAVEKDGTWLYVWDAERRCARRITKAVIGVREVFVGSAVVRTFPHQHGHVPWSPDGKRLLVPLPQEGGREPGLYMLDPDTLEAQFLDKETGLAEWSPKAQ